MGSIEWLNQREQRIVGTTDRIDKIVRSVRAMDPWIDRSDQ